MSNYALKVNVHYGCDEIVNIGKISAEYGRKACIVFDPIFKNSSLIIKVVKLLKKAGVSYACFCEFRSDPDCTEVDLCVDLIRREKCDFLIAIGGGSCIDTAKAAAVTAKNGWNCWDYCYQRLSTGKYGFIRFPDKGALPIVAVPTTSGTGSEVNQGCVISNREIENKSGFMHTSLFPSASIVDPRLTLGLSPVQTAYTGFDVFSHAFESYMLIGPSTYLSEAIALEAMRLFGEAFVGSVKDGNDIEMRAKMSKASTLAGLDLAMTDTCVGHILGQPLSVMFHMTHGATLAVIMDSIITWLIPSAEKRLACVTDCLESTLKDKTQKEKAAVLPGIIRELKRRTGIDKTLGDYGIKEEDIPRIINFVIEKYGIDASIFKGFARVPTVEDLTNILKMSL